jgi:hypothetical protein
MDLYRIIQDLNAEKEKLERVIASLKELQRFAGPRRSGRARQRGAPRTQVDETPSRSRKSRNG